MAPLPSQGFPGLALLLLDPPDRVVQHRHGRPAAAVLLSKYWKRSINRATVMGVGIAGLGRRFSFLLHGLSRQVVSRKGDGTSPPLNASAPGPP